MTDQQPEPVEGPVPEGKPAVDGLGNPIRYDTEGRILTRNRIERAVFDVPDLEHAVGELAWLSASVFPLTTERVQAGEGTGVEAMVQAMCSLIGRLVAPEAGGLAPVDGAVVAISEGTDTIREAVKATVEEHYRRHLEQQANPDGTGAYL